MVRLESMLQLGLGLGIGLAALYLVGWWRVRRCVRTGLALTLVDVGVKVWVINWG